MKTKLEESEMQKRYYAETATKYDEMHISENDEHFIALTFLVASLDYLKIRSILDIGSGTGRVLHYIKKLRPNIHIVGIEPVKELREVGYSQGLSKECLVDGNATKLEYADSDFDLVCEFAVLHHVRRPEAVISEMIRVAKKAIFISDANNFGQGTQINRTVKQIINYLGCWKLADFIKTKGKGYTISEGDGLSYSYSVFNNFKQIKAHCKRVHIVNTQGGDISIYRTASQVALLGIKK